MDPYKEKALLTNIALYTAWFLAIVLVSTAVMAGVGLLPVVFALGGDIFLGVAAVLCMLFAAQKPEDPNAASHH